MKAKITKRAIDDLRSRAKSEGRTLYLRDDDLTGFGAVSTKAGTCSYFIEYRLGGRGTTQKRVTLGKHGALTPDEARQLAKGELGKVARGADVAQEKREAREKLTGATLRDLIERYLKGHAKPTRYWTEKRARLLSDDLKALHGKPATLIKRGEIAAIIDKVEGRSQAAARLLFADIRPIFAWALDRAAIEQNPMAGMKGPQPLDARDRVLSDDEIKAFWQAVTEENWPFSAVFKVLLLDDLRRTAASGMAALGFQPHVIERVLNHVSGAQGGLTGVYQRHDYREERKRAIMAWGAHVMQIVSADKAASNVVRLRVA